MHFSGEFSPMNIELKGIAILIIACSTLFLTSLAHGVTVSCMTAYEEGGSRAVLGSPECPRRIISPQLSENSTGKCDSAMAQGRRDHQEDRAVCNLDIKVPVLGKDGKEEASIGMAAIFDGHGGAEASELASRKVFDYFFVNVLFALYSNGLSTVKENIDSHAANSVHMAVDKHSLRPILEAALKRTIQDIDFEFTKQALDKGEGYYTAGSTAAIVVLSNGEFLTAHVGDSKAILCSAHAHGGEKGVSSREIYVEELTKDHHPDREDERSRIEAAGGFVSVWGVPRVNGMLAVSRAIGDIYLKRYGVIAEPEVGPWRRFDPEKEYLVIASDGIFESLSLQDVCNVLVSEEPSSSSIVRQAFRKGSTDNLSAIVISGIRK